MLNNKGFVVSALLYTLLIAFLIYLAITLKELSSSASLISHANDELTNGGSSIKPICVNKTVKSIDQYSDLVKALRKLGEKKVTRIYYLDF